MYVCMYVVAIRCIRTKLVAAIKRRWHHLKTISNGKCRSQCPAHTHSNTHSTYTQRIAVIRVASSMSTATLSADQCTAVDNIQSGLLKTYLYTCFFYLCTVARWHSRTQSQGARPGEHRPASLAIYVQVSMLRWYICILEILLFEDCCLWCGEESIRLNNSAECDILTRLRPDWIVLQSVSGLRY